MTANVVDLVLPGLFDAALSGTASPPPTPALEKLLARARPHAEPCRAWEWNLLSRFGIHCPDSGADAPFAALALYGRYMDPGSAFWLQADPVHLYADRDQLVLFDAGHHRISEAESDELVTLFNRHFADRGWHLLAPDPQHWYLGAPRRLSVQTHALDQARGYGIHPFQPKGEDAGTLRRLLTEVEMLFHQAPANQARETRGEPRINGLWLSGGGVLPEAKSPLVTRVAGDISEPLVLGAARLSGAVAVEGREGIAADGHQVIFSRGLLDARSAGDSVAHAQYLRDWDRRLDSWYRPLSSGKLSEIRVSGGQVYRYDLGRRDLRRWWRRSRPLGHYGRLESPAQA
ncbi:MAG: hypothetical protein ABFS23_01990 [Pseudomonadota bacterium]